MKRKAVWSRGISPFGAFGNSRRDRGAADANQRRRRLRFEHCEQRALLSVQGLATISGTKLDDLTGNGFSPDDVPLGGVSIQLYADDGDGMFNDAVDALVDTQATDAATGMYTFNGVAEGVYFIREVAPAGMVQTAGPQFYTVLVAGDCVFPLGGTTIDDFEAPVPADAFFISALDADPTLFQHAAATGIVGGQRDALINVLGAANPLSASVVVGFDGAEGLFSFASAVPGTTATLQYDGTDVDDPGPPAALINARGLANDLTDAGASTGILFDFLGVDPGLGADLQLQIRATSPGGGTADFTGTVPESLIPFVHFVSFTDFATAGGFSFADVDSLEIQFNAVGIADVDFEVRTIATTDMRNDGYDFGNFRDISIHGMKFNDIDGDGLKDEGEPGLPGWVIELSGADGNVIAEATTTDDAGNYWFMGLGPGTYSVQEVQQAGWTQTAGIAGYTIVTGQDVPSGRASEGNDFGNFRDISIHGMKFNDLDGDGTKDEGEPGLPGWVIELSDIAGNVIDTTTTDDAGNYWFMGLGPGTYSVQEVQQAGWTQTAGIAGYTIVTGQDVPSGGASEGNDFGNRRLNRSSLSGFVYNDKDNDGVFDAAESGIPNVLIMLMGVDNTGAMVNRMTTTDAAGRYEFTELTAGTYEIKESQPAGFLDGIDTIGTPGGMAENDRFFDITLPEGFNGADNNFGEVQPSSLAGFVYLDVNNNGVKDAPELGINNVTVTLTGVDDLGNNVNLAAQTAAGGAYIFSNLRPGTYRLTESHPAGFIDGIDTIGTQGGLTANDTFFQIVLTPCVNGLHNNFGERGLDPTVVSKDLLLSSSPQPPDLSDLGVTVGRDPVPAPIDQSLPVDPAMESWVRNLYEDALNRPGSDAEVHYWIQRLAQGASYTAVTDTFTHGVERRSNFINQLYFDYLGRGVDPTGLASWLTTWQQTGGPEEIQAGIIGSPEYYRFAGGTDADWVDALYHNILNRGAAQHEIDYWVNRLDDATTRDVVLGFVLSREYRGDMVRGWYIDYLHRQAEESGVDYWVDQIESGRSQGHIQSGLLASAEYRSLP